jgi:hypothetical protein
LKSAEEQNGLVNAILCSGYLHAISPALQGSGSILEFLRSSFGLCLLLRARTATTTHPVQQQHAMFWLVDFIDTDSMTQLNIGFVLVLSSSHREELY